MSRKSNTWISVSSVLILLALAAAVVTLLTVLRGFRNPDLPVPVVFEMPLGQDLLLSRTGSPVGSVQASGFVRGMADSLSRADGEMENTLTLDYSEKVRNLTVSAVDTICAYTQSYVGWNLLLSYIRQNKLSAQLDMVRGKIREAEERFMRLALNSETLEEPFSCYGRFGQFAIVEAGFQVLNGGGLYPRTHYNPRNAYKYYEPWYVRALLARALEREVAMRGMFRLESNKVVVSARADTCSLVRVVREYGFVRGDFGVLGDAIFQGVRVAKCDR